MMLQLSRDPPSPLTGVKETELIPDPWETPPLNTPDAKSLPIDWHLSTETHSLMSVPVVTELPQLPSHKEKPSQILLWDWLKLKTGDAKGLAVELINALTMLSWLEMSA